MIIIDDDLTLSPGGVNLTYPIIGWHNVVTLTNISATTEDDDFPASNLSNPSTNLKWRGVTNSPGVSEYITIVTGETDPIDYLAVAGHNWGSAGIVVSLETLDSGVSPPVWVELVQETVLTDDSPVLFRFVSQVIANIRIRLQPGTAVPEAAVVYCGELLVMERSFPVTQPHTPLDYGREANVVNGMSESGKFLGRIVLGQHAESVAEFQYLTPAWYRSDFDPFVVASKEYPFFWAWYPEQYEEEVGYAWLINSPKPAVDTVTGRMHVSLQMRGVV